MTKKENELKLYQRDHFEQKVEKKLEPEIEREELRIKTTVQNILNKGTKSFAKNIGATKVKDYRFDKDDRDCITVKNCQDQLEKWAEAQARQLAEKTPQGQRLAYLKAIKETANDAVKEASVPNDLIDRLSILLKLVGVEWTTNLPALPKPKGK